MIVDVYFFFAVCASDGQREARPTAAVRVRHMQSSRRRIRRTLGCVLLNGWIFLNTRSFTGFHGLELVRNSRISYTSVEIEFGQFYR